MGARELIGLEAAIAELGSLYRAAKEFVALRAAAEEELRLGTERLAADLRAHVRHDTLDADVVDRTAAYVATLRTRWQQVLEELRSSADYREACDAWRDGNFAKLGELLPRLFADVRPVPAPAELFLDLSPSAGRRGGTSPFQSAEECTRRILAWRDEGIATRERGGDWWRADLAHLELVDGEDLLENPIGVRFDGGSLPAALFVVGDDDRTYRLYGSRIRAPFSVVIREESDDAWWQAAESSYEEFRDELVSRLRGAGLSVAIVA